MLDDRNSALVRTLCELMIPGSGRIWPEVYIDALLARMPQDDRGATLDAFAALARFSVSADPEIVASCPVIPIVNRMEALGQIQAWPRPAVPASSECMAVLGEEVHDLMLGLTSPRAMLRQAQNRIDAIMRARGYYS